MEPVPSAGNISSRFTCSQALQGSTAGCDGEQWPSSAWASHGQSVGTEIGWRAGYSYQQESEKISGWQHKKIGVEPITHDPEYVTGYGMKGLKRGSFPYDDVLIFPRTVSELPSQGPDPRKGPVRGAGGKPMYDFERK
jgi:hypothetical protein